MNKMPADILVKPKNTQVEVTSIILNETYKDRASTINK